MSPRLRSSKPSARNTRGATTATTATTAMATATATRRSARSRPSALRVGFTGDNKKPASARGASVRWSLEDEIPELSVTRIVPAPPQQPMLPPQPPHHTPRSATRQVMTPKSAMKARRVSWGVRGTSDGDARASPRSSIGSDEGVRSQHDPSPELISPPGSPGSVAMFKLSPRSSIEADIGGDCRSPGTPAHMLPPGSVGPAVAGARWVLERRQKREREQGGEDAETTEEPTLPPPVHNDAHDSVSPQSSAGSGATPSGFTLRLRVNLPEGKSERLTLQYGEDSASAASRFGRQRGLRPEHIAQVREAIDLKLQQLKSQLREAPPPASTQDSRDTGVDGHGSGGCGAKQLILVSMSEEDVSDWRLLQAIKRERANPTAAAKAGAASPSAGRLTPVVDRLSVAFREHWGANTGGPDSSPTKMVAAPAPAVLGVPSEQPRLLRSYPTASPSSEDADDDDDQTRYEGDYDDFESDSSEEEDGGVDATSAELSAALSPSLRRRHSEPAVHVPPLMVVNEGRRRASVQVGVAGKTPKEERSITLARTPTKHVRNMSRHKRRSRRAQQEKALHSKLRRCQELLAAATHRRGHARHVIDLPAHVVRQYRDIIRECQLELAQLSGLTADSVPVWFVGDQCTTVTIPGDAGEAVSMRTGRVAYVGRLPHRLGGGVWVGVVLDVKLAGLGHDGRLEGCNKRFFECELGHGHFFRPTDLVVTTTETETEGREEEARPKQAEGL